ncbi:MAG: hypothetical protein KBF65_16435, partial [Rubrivivax sp.]|nr:hypothetical protein [Rubrivivax sp.]
MLPAPLHTFVQPGVFQRAAHGPRVRPGFEHARCDGADEQVEVVAQRVLGQQRGHGARARAPARSGEEQRHQRLQALHGIEQAHAVGWQ